MSLRSSLLIAVFLGCGSAYAVEEGCRVHPRDFNDLSTRLVQNYHNQKLSFPDSVVIQTQVAVNSATNQYEGTVEGFYRPNEDGFFPVIPVPILGLYLSRDRNVVYICAHGNTDPSKTHVTVYILRGFHLDKSHIGTFAGNVVRKPHLKVKPAVAALLDTNRIRKFFLKIFSWIPLQKPFFHVLDAVQRFVAQMLGDFTGIGVERLEVTPTYLRLSSGVNLDNPRQRPRISKTVRFDVPENVRLDDE